MYAQAPLAAKQIGAYYTPHPVAAALVQFAARAPTDRLLDPACGDGRFVACHANSVGVERDIAAAAIAAERAPCADVHHRDFFSWAESTNERFDCAAGNPPFIRYQTFAGDTRKRALRLCRDLGVWFSGLTTSWAPFLVVTASLLRPGGRMAFVVPASIGHAPHAAPLVEYLVGRFDEVRIVAVRRKLFPHLSEDCWLLFADGFGGATDHIQFVPVERFDHTLACCPAKLVSVDEWRHDWNRRLRPYLLGSTERSLYQEATRSESCARLGEIASVGIGYVTGDNEFFHLRPSEAEHWQIPQRYLHPTVRNGRALPSQALASGTVDEWFQSDKPVLLLRLPKDADLPRTVRKYLDSPRGQAARCAYKCRNRKPWYSVPDVRVPTFFLTYMAGAAPSLVRNNAAATCTNALHAVDLHKEEDADRLVHGWQSSCLKLSCEIEGHPLGGGVLKLEPREAARLVLPSPGGALPVGFEREACNAVSTLRKWRHCDQSVDERYVVSAPQLVSKTRRLEWSPDSSAFGAEPFRNLDYSVRLSG